MPEEILFENEQQLNKGDVADYLRTVADRLESGDPVSLESGSDSITVEVPSTVEFEVKVEREGPSGGPNEIGFELELEWDEGAGDGGDGSDGGLVID